MWLSASVALAASQAVVRRVMGRTNPWLKRAGLGGGCPGGK
jgi:hypothetical protein